MWREKLRLKKNNPVAGLYPFAKLWILALYSLCCLILSGMKTGGYPVYFMCAASIPLILAAVSGIFKKYIHAFGALCVPAGVILTAQAVLFPSAAYLWELDVLGLFTLKIYEAGLQKGMMLAFSLLNIGGIFLWLFQCTENKELVRAFEKKGMSPKAGYVFLSTLQMIPALQQSSRTIMCAQSARGVETRGNVFVRMKAFAAILIPLITGAVGSAEERVLTLEARGFTAKCAKTRVFDIEPNGRESIAVAAAAAFTIIIIAWRVITWASL